MTCIVGLVDGDELYIGADSVGTGSLGGVGLFSRSDPKVFWRGSFLIGCAGSYRAAQLLRYTLDVKERYPGQDPFEYMATEFVMSVRSCFENGGFMKRDNGREEGGWFLVGYESKLYNVDDDYHVGMPADEWDSIGTGIYAARGSLHTTGHISIRGLSPRQRVELALEAASYLTVGVRPPYVIECMQKESQL